MNIWIDIGHPAQLNFYINPIKKLVKSHDLTVTILNRGRLPDIAKKELAKIENCNLFIIGKHRKNSFSIIFEANLIRLLKLFYFFRIHKPDISIGNGFLHTIVSKFYGVPSIVFNDDIERRLNAKISNYFGSEVNYSIGSKKELFLNKSNIFNALKEWSYLSPNSFEPQEASLKEFEVSRNNYIFVREVSSGTMNYKDQNEDLICGISTRFPENYKVLFSLENKHNRDMYPKDWILLEEPLKDIYSLIYFAKALVSSGDSMAREGAVLGVPSIYCGIRKMDANKVLEDKQRLFHLDVEKVPKYLNYLVLESDLKDKNIFRSALMEEWIDVSELIENKINKRLN